MEFGLIIQITGKPGLLPNMGGPMSVPLKNSQDIHSQKRQMGGKYQALQTDILLGKYVNNK
jgi:hypothetical protein